MYTRTSQWDTAADWLTADNDL